MIPELQDGIALQISVLNEQIATQRESLARETDRETGAVTRERIAQTEVLVKKIASLQTEILVAESEAERAAQSYAQWRELVQQVRALTKTRDELARQILPLREELEIAERRLTFARDELTAHRAVRFGPLVLESEKVEHRKNDARLETGFEQRRKDYSLASEKLGSVQGETLRLSREIDQLSWRANRIAPRGAVAPDPNSFAVMSIS